MTNDDEGHIFMFPLVSVIYRLYCYLSVNCL